MMETNSTTGDSEDTEKLVREVETLVGTVRTNLHSLFQSWAEFRATHMPPQAKPPPPQATPLPPGISVENSSRLKPSPLSSPSAHDLENTDHIVNIPLELSPHQSPHPPSPAPPSLSLPHPLSPSPTPAPNPPSLSPTLPSLSASHPPSPTPPSPSQTTPHKLTTPLKTTPLTQMSDSDVLDSLAMDAFYDQATPTNNKTTPTTQMVQVSSSDLDRLATEALMLKELLPSVLNSRYTSCVSKVPVLEERVWQARRERDEMAGECRKVRRQYDVLLADYEQDKKEMFAVNNEVTELRDMLTQQAEYCSSMGSACSMLLWRVSRHEECVQSILSGSKVDEFLQLAGSTLLSFLEAYRDSTPPGETHPEAQFVLALCGIITNIAASTYGRDFLCRCESGKGLIYTLCSVLGTTPPGSHYAKLCNLILMALYNISINQNGAHCLTSNTGLLPQLVHLLQEESDSINRLHVLKLLQSMILEPESTDYARYALSVIPSPVVQRFSTDLNPEVQNTALELLRDLATLRRQYITMS